MNQPNKPCECGSGKKQKKCHYFGAPNIGPELPSKNTPNVVRSGSADLLMATMLCMMTAHMRR